MGITSGEGEERVRPREAEEPPLRGTPLLRGMTLAEFGELDKLPMAEWGMTDSRGSTTGQTGSIVNWLKD